MGTAPRFRAGLPHMGPRRPTRLSSGDSTMSCPSQRIIRCRFDSVDSVSESRLQEAINGHGCERPTDNCRSVTLSIHARPLLPHPYNLHYLSSPCPFRSSVPQQLWLTLRLLIRLPSLANGLSFLLPSYPQFCIELIFYIYLCYFCAF